MFRTLACLSAAVWLASAPAFADTKSEIDAVEARFWNAVKSGSKADLDALIAEEFNYQHTTGNTYTKPEIMDIFTSGKITVTFWGPLSIDIKDYGDTVISYGVSPAEGALGGAKYAGKLRFVDVWRRTGPGAAWRLTHRNSELLP